MMLDKIDFDKYRAELIGLTGEIIANIADDDRASDDPDDDLPGVCLTVGTNDFLSGWGYQTGDNSFTGGAYGFAHWAVCYLYRDSVPEEVADDVAGQWADLICA